MNRWVGSAWPLVAVIAAGCSAWNRIDVCEQKQTTPVTVNQRFEGVQRLSPASVVALPGGNAVAVFTSEVGGRDFGEVTEIRSTRLTPDGARVLSCDKNDVVDDLLVPADLAMPGKQLRESIWVAPPPGSNRPGLVTYRTEEGGRPQEIWGFQMESDGCPYGTSSDRRKAFLIAGAGPGGSVFGNSAVALGGPDHPFDDFMVIWQELGADMIMRSKARVLRLSANGAEFLPTVPSQEGAAVDLLSVPEFTWGLAPALVGDKVAVAVHYGSQTSSNVAVWFFDDRLQAQGPPVQVARDGKRGELLLGRVVTAAWDGRTLLVGWIHQEGNRVRMFTRALDGNGYPRGPALRVGTAAGVNDGFGTAMAWPDQGFLVAWRQQGGQGDASGPRLMGRLLDPNGRPAFTGQACGEEPFVIAHQPDGDREMPNLVRLESNDALASWTEGSKKAADTSGSSIQARILAVGSLFVGKARPGSGVRPPLVDADPRAGDGGPVNMCAVDTPATRRSGEQCLCDTDCETGSTTCAIELPEGFPGGMCIKPCDPKQPDSCGEGGLCKGNATAGFCWRTCATHADCGPGRACWGTPKTCYPYCASDAECRSGHCDPYRGLCAETARSLPGKGVWEECLRHDDCRSRFCFMIRPASGGATINRCATSCYPPKANCPAGTACVPYPSGDGGLCLPDCTPQQTCTNPLHTCVTDDTNAPGPYCI